MYLSPSQLSQINSRSLQVEWIIVFMTQCFLSELSKKTILFFAHREPTSPISTGALYMKLSPLSLLLSLSSPVVVAVVLKKFILQCYKEKS